MYTTIVDMSFLEMGFMRLMRRPHYTVMVRTSTAVPWRDCPVHVGNDGYPSGFL